MAIVGKELTNYMDILKTGIEKKVSEEITKDVTEKLVKDFREKAEAIVKAEAERISLDSIRDIKDLMRFEERIGVIFRYLPEDQNTAHTEEDIRHV